MYFTAQTRAYLAANDGFHDFAAYATIATDTTTTRSVTSGIGRGFFLVEFKWHAIFLPLRLAVTSMSNNTFVCISVLGYMCFIKIQFMRW